VKIWKVNLKSVATFYRTSAQKICKAEKDVAITIKRIPAYFDIRFVEHLIQLCKVILNNLPSMRKHWQAIIAKPKPESIKAEKAMAEGFLKVWADENLQLKLSCLMVDLLRHLETLQKDGQKSKITIPDIELSKKTVINRLALMEEKPYPGGVEEKFCNDSSDDELDDGTARRRVFNSLVPTTRRCWSAIRKETVLSCKEFLSQRIHEDQNDIVSGMNKFLDAGEND